MQQRPLREGDRLRRRYVITQISHLSSTGVLYKALDEGVQPARCCAIKERAIELLDAERATTIATFLHRSARLTALAHPAIPAVLDYFVEDNCAYLVTDFVEGRDLEELLYDPEVEFTPAQVVKWGIELCDALHYLHTRFPEPLIFRDLKPANLIVNPQGRIWLVDLDTIAHPSDVLTEPPLGTEGYAAPEQYEGMVSPAIDIYALGVCLYHLLTRRDPRLEPPFSFAQHSPRVHNPDVPEALAAVVMHALALDPAARFASAAEMAAALRRLMLEEGTTSGTPSE